MRAIAAVCGVLVFAVCSFMTGAWVQWFIYASAYNIPILTTHMWCYMATMCGIIVGEVLLLENVQPIQK